MSVGVSAYIPTTVLFYTGFINHVEVDNEDASMIDIAVEQRLFFARYVCYIPNAAFDDAASVYQTGIPDIDEHNRTKLRQVSTSPVGMIRYHADGYEVKLKLAKDAYQIYLDLKQHQKNWLSALMSTVSVNHPSLEDFRKMDEFAKDLHTQFQYQRHAVETAVNKKEDLLSGLLSDLDFLNKQEEAKRELHRGYESCYPELVREITRLSRRGKR